MVTRVDDKFLASTPPFRKGTLFEKTKFGFVFNSGGIGDYVHWTTAIQHSIETNPHLEGYVVSPEYFGDLARLWFRSYYPRFKVIVTPDFTKESRLDGIPCLVPDRNQMANANSHHLFSLGWIFFAQRAAPPNDWMRLPQISGDEVDIDAFNLPKEYAVIPVSATADNRRLSGQLVNDISRHLLSKKITPVYLGKKDLAADYAAKESDGLDFSLGVDLRERTTLLEAAVIMANSRMVMGLDGGLLHVACCSSVPVVFCFTSVDPEVRIPPRRPGEHTSIIAPPEALECRFCQTKMKFVLGHDFKNCLYGDNLCVKSLTAEPFKKAIDRILKLKS